MPNWCSTAYVIDGDAKEVKQLYELMKGLEERKTPSVENGFGTTWLGCLVDALGKDWNDVLKHVSQVQASTLKTRLAKQHIQRRELQLS